MEAVLLSTPISFLLAKKEEGNVWANSFMQLKKKIDKPLAAILSLNTVAHTIGAAGVGAQAVKIFGEMYFGIISAILTILILLFSEIIPKTIGARYTKSLARISYYFIKTMIVITYPLVILASFVTRLFANRKRKQTTSREEIAALASLGAGEGLFSDKEFIIIQNILKLKNVKVAEIMTPRVVVSVASEDLPLAEFLKNKEYLKFSRIPVFSGKLENITGYVIRQNVLEKLAEDKHNLKLKEIKRDIVIVPSSMAIFSLWEKLLERKEHIALIVDEYGGIDGIVTMEDIIETLLGLEILDEKDTITDMQKFARDRWLTRQAKYSLLEQLSTPPSDAP